MALQPGRHPKPPPQERLGHYEYHCGGPDCITAFFNEPGHAKIQRNGAWCEDCGNELILIWKPGDPINL